MNTTLLAALNAILWLGAFVWLYQVAQRHQQLQNRLDALEHEWQPPQNPAAG
jgi:type II secretory pathway component PulJ